MVLQNARHIGGDEQRRASAHSTVRVRSSCNDVHLDGVAALRAGLATGLLDPASRVWFSENVAVMRSCLGAGVTPATDARSAEIVHARQRRDAPTEPASQALVGDIRHSARDPSQQQTHLYRISWHTPHVMASSMCLSSAELVFVRPPACSTAGGTTSCMRLFLEACATRNSQHAKQVCVHSASMLCTQSTLGSRTLPLIL